MRLPLRIALRYIFTKRSFHFITVISIISIIGIIIGVAALISVMSIFNGFREFTERQLIGYDPHIRLISNNSTKINDFDTIISRIGSIKEIKFSMPVNEGRIIGINKSNMQVINLLSINPLDISKTSGIAKTIISGSFFLGEYYNLQTIVLGAGIADRLQALPGDTLSLMSAKMIESSIKSFSRKKPLKVIVSGIFQTNNQSYDNYYAYSSNRVGRKLFNSKLNSCTSIDIKLNSIDDLNKTKNKLKKLLNSDVDILTWYDLHRDLYQVMDLERILAFVVLSLIIFIAVFNILASLSMVVVEKRQDIGVMKSMGASQSQIKNIFILQGLLIGLISTALGTLLGLAFCYGQIKFSWFSMDGSNFLINAIPVSVHIFDIILIVVFSILLSFFATIYPAKRAAQTLIIESIREE